MHNLYCLLEQDLKKKNYVLGDPIENRYVALKDSEIFPNAGEGMVAKENIPKNTIFSHMSGYILTNSQYKDAYINLPQGKFLF